MLKRLIIDRFKGFGEKTTLEFFPGIGAILGPNGCGKSNVVDALRWVLGEQKISDLRGDRQEDLIFSGSGGAKAEHYTQVEAVFDNTHQLFKLPQTEVSILRRLYRSGEGEYYICAEACRLKDIQHLLYDTGLGRTGYSIIAQGGINRILMGGHQEKIRLIEEAGSVTRTREKQREYTRKIKRTEDGLTRIEDLFRDLSQRRNVLERQSRASREHFLLKEQIHVLELALALRKVTRFEEQLEKRKSEIVAQQKRKTSLAEKITALEAKYEEVRQADTQEKLSRERASFALSNEKNLLIEKQKSLHAREKERQEECLLREKRLTQSLAQVQAHDSQLKKEKKKLASIQQKIQQEEGVLQKLEENFRQLAQKRKQEQEKLEKNLHEISQAVTIQEGIRRTLDVIPEELFASIEKTFLHSDAALMSSSTQKNAQNKTFSRHASQKEREQAFAKAWKTCQSELASRMKKLCDDLLQVSNVQPAVQPTVQPTVQPASAKIRTEIKAAQKFIEEKIKVVVDLEMGWGAAITRSLGILQLVEAKLETKNKAMQKLDAERKKEKKLHVLREHLRHTIAKTDLAFAQHEETKQVLRGTLTREHALAEATHDHEKRMEAEHIRLLGASREAKKFYDAGTSLLAELARERKLLLKTQHDLDVRERSLKKNADEPTKDLSPLAGLHKVEETLTRHREQFRNLQQSMDSLTTDQAIIHHDITHVLEAAQEQLDEDLMRYLRSGEAEKAQVRLTKMFAPEEIDAFREETISEKHEELAKELAKERSAISIKHLPPRALDKLLRFLKQRLQGRGDVNPLAEKELALVREEYEKMMTGREDIRLSLKNLNELEKQLTRETKMLFKKAFHTISKNFSVLIKELFQGGTGTMVLKSHIDPDQRELHITVQPPGKKAQKIDLFSGGEKSLIVLALMFAIFMVKPAPFCVLDEADAALDDENIARFLRLLTRFKAETQIFVISHNRKTFNVFDYLYGVSMREGITRVFSLKLPTPEKTPFEEPTL